MEEQMQWRSNVEIQYALSMAAEIMQTDGDHADLKGRIAAIREMVKAVSSPLPTHRACITAALGMVAAGMDPTADDVAWFVRDLQIGFPQNPSFGGKIYPDGTEI